MPRPSNIVSSRQVRAYAIGVSLLFGLLGALLTGCGISLSEGHSQTEVFKRLVVVGPLKPGGELRLGLNYEQPYATTLEVQCDLLTTAKSTPTPKPTKDPSGRTPTPTPVRIAAPIPTPGNRISIILVESIGPNPSGTTADESTPVLGSISRRFTAPEQPGRYTVRCYTPADRNNQMFKAIRVE